MHTIVQNKMNDVLKICQSRQVRRLSLFGSAAQKSAPLSIGDLDFLVEFQPLAHGKHVEHYFGLLEDLEQLFGMPIDLVEPAPIRNPYFRKTVEETHIVIYDAA